MSRILSRRDLDFLLYEMLDVETNFGLLKAGEPLFSSFVSDFIKKSYDSGETTRIFETYIATKGIDPASVPRLVRERWI